MHTNLPLASRETGRYRTEVLPETTTAGGGLLIAFDPLGSDPALPTDPWEEPSAAIKAVEKAIRARTREIADIGCIIQPTTRLRDIGADDQKGRGTARNGASLDVLPMSQHATIL